MSAVNPSQLIKISTQRSLLLTFFTLGVYYFVWQHKRMQQLEALGGVQSVSYWKWLAYSILTLGFYHLYHEYLDSQEILRLQELHGAPRAPENFHLLCLILSVVSFFVVTEVVHQEELNKLVDFVQRK